MSFAAIAITAAVSTAPLPANIAFVEEATVSGVDVRLSDVADLSALPTHLRPRAAEIVVLRFAPGQSAIRVPAARLAERARGRLPILAAYLPAGEGIVTVRREPATSAAGAVARHCIRLATSVAAGAVPRAEDVIAAPCGDQPGARAFRFDPVSGLARASRSLGEGEIVLALPASAFAAVRPGDPVRLTARVGPVEIERRVIAVQAARAGEPVFVRGEDGEVFAARQADDGVR